MKTLTNILEGKIRLTLENQVKLPETGRRSQIS